jgi:hypothetical protein
MISIKGRWYDGRTSSVTEAVCSIYGSGEVRVVPADGGDPLAALPRFDVRVSPRLARTPRSLLFPGGEKFETDDHESVDRVVEEFSRASWPAGLIHRLESRLIHILAALFLAGLFLWAGAEYGVPFTAKVVAENLPPSAYRLASEQTLHMLHRTLLQPSDLDGAVRDRVKAHFRPILDDHPDLELNILFRKAPGLGPNAFALPDGTILFTDEMVLIAEHDHELLAVLAHEIGHVVHRHGMRRMVQGSLLGFALMAITGDVSGSSEIFLALPVMLTELAYSREFEREADRYALSYLRARDVPPLHFARLMKRIQEKQGSKGKAGKGGWTSYLSTHPSIDERLESFKE